MWEYEIIQPLGNYNINLCKDNQENITNLAALPLEVKHIIADAFTLMAERTFKQNKEVGFRNML